MEEDHEEEEQRQEVGSRPTTPLAMPQVRENEEVHLQNPPIFESDNEDEDEEEDDFLNGDVQDYDTILNDLKSQWLLTEAHHSVSKSASQAFWKLGLLYFTKLHTAPGRKKKTPLFKSIRNQMHKELLPPVSLEIGYKNLTSGEIVVVNDTVTPVKRFSPNNFEKLYEVASVEVSYIENYPNEHLKKTHLSFFFPSCPTEPFFSQVNVILKFLFFLRWKKFPKYIAQTAKRISKMKKPRFSLVWMESRRHVPRPFPLMYTASNSMAVETYSLSGS